MTNTTQSINVMVVEDHDLQQAIAIQALSEVGINNTLTASNGLEALTAIQRQTFDIVLCDLNMPEMDGIEFISQLVKTAPKTALIIYSSMETSLLKAVKDMACSSGLLVLGILTKPIEIKTLKALVNSYLTREIRPDQAVGHFPWPDVSAESLEIAIQANQFELFYQPKVFLATGELSCVEALARWNHPELGYVSPGLFIPVLESSGLIEGFSMKLIDQALQQILSWHQQQRSIPVAINISPVMVENRRLPDQILAKTMSWSVSPSMLILEITETGIINNMTDALATLARLRMNGFSLSIDDFGIGYSSMQQLKRIPFSELKIDRSFVHNLHNDETLRAIAEANICLAHDLGLKTVAEGVEQQEDWHLLKSLDCDLAQGFLIGKPMPAQQFDEWESDWKSRYPL